MNTRERAAVTELAEAVQRLAHLTVHMIGTAEAGMIMNMAQRTREVVDDALQYREPQRPGEPGPARAGEGVEATGE